MRSRRCSSPCIATWSRFAGRRCGDRESLETAQQSVDKMVRLTEKQRTNLKQVFEEACKAPPAANAGDAVASKLSKLQGASRNDDEILNIVGRVIRAVDTVVNDDFGGGHGHSRGGGRGHGHTRNHNHGQGGTWTYYYEDDGDYYDNKKKSGMTKKMKSGTMKSTRMRTKTGMVEDMATVMVAAGASAMGMGKASLRLPSGANFFVGKWQVENRVPRTARMYYVLVRLLLHQGNDSELLRHQNDSHRSDGLCVGQRSTDARINQLHGRQQRHSHDLDDSRPHDQPCPSELSFSRDRERRGSATGNSPICHYLELQV